MGLLQGQEEPYIGAVLLHGKGTAVGTYAMW